MVDTGSDVTTIHPADAIMMGLDYSQLERSKSSQSGVGGIEHPFEATAVVLFKYEHRGYVYQVPVSIPEPTEYNEGFPSLLGRDILQYWRLIHNPYRNRLTVKILRAHEVYPMVGP